METPTKQPPVRATTPEQVKPAHPAPTVNAELETDFRKLEHRFAQTKDQPLEEQPVADLLSAYQALENSQQLSGTSRRMSVFRVKYLQALLKQQEQLKTAKQDEADFTARQAQAIEQQKAIEQRMKDQGIAVYSAVGQLQTSSIQKDGAPMMRLVDPADNRTLIYIRTADVSQRAMVGKFVGVRGSVAEDTQLSVDYIEPVEMVQVDPAQVLKGITAKIYPSSFITRAMPQ